MPEVYTNIRACTIISAQFLDNKTVNALNMAQDTINERLKFLINKLGLSVRAFSSALEVPDSNTRNYLDKNTKLNSEYLERIAHHFKNVNLSWLITGIGDPIIGVIDTGIGPGPISIISSKNNSGNAIGINHGQATQHQGGRQGGAARVTDDTAARLQAAEEKITLLTSQLADKERTIQILLKQQS